MSKHTRVHTFVYVKDEQVKCWRELTFFINEKKVWHFPTRSMTTINSPRIVILLTYYFNTIDVKERLVLAIMSCISFQIHKKNPLGLLQYRAV